MGSAFDDVPRLLISFQNLDPHENMLEFGIFILTIQLTVI